MYTEFRVCRVYKVYRVYDGLSGWNLRTGLADGVSLPRGRLADGVLLSKWLKVFKLV